MVTILLHYRVMYYNKSNQNQTQDKQLLRPKCQTIISNFNLTKSI